MDSTWQSFEGSVGLFPGIIMGFHKMSNVHQNVHPNVDLNVNTNSTKVLTAMSPPQQLFDGGSRAVHRGHADARTGADDAGDYNYDVHISHLDIYVHLYGFDGHDDDAVQGQMMGGPGMQGMVRPGQ